MRIQSIFHKCVKSRFNRNSIKALKEGVNWVQSPMEVKRVVKEYFVNHVSSSFWECPTIDGVPFDMFSEEENRRLVAPFLLEEIEVVVAESEGDKSPGPDGFNFAFVKRFRYFMKDEV
jgi:hypothetical protein